MIALPETSAPILPRLLFVTGCTREVEEYFQLSAVQPWVEGLGHHFQIEVVQDAECLLTVAEKFAPDLVLFFGAKYQLLYSGPALDFRERLGVPVVALSLMDAHSPAREAFFAQASRLGVEAIFTIDTGMREMAGDFAPMIFYCPWFVNEKMSCDFALPKTVPIALIGDGFVSTGNDWRYPWRREVAGRLLEHFPVFTSPRPGKNYSHRMVGAAYGQMLNRSWLALACGASRHIFMKKNLEIPASRCCLVTEPNEALVHLGFRDGENCLFATPDDVLEKCRDMLADPTRLLEITDRGRAFVLENHRAIHRTVIADWLACRQRLGAGQRILQKEICGPLEVTGDNDGRESIHLSAHSPFQLALEEARRFWRAGEYAASAAAAARAGHLLRQTTEPSLLLAWAALGCHQPQEALGELRAILLRSVQRAAMTPDPLIWATYLLGLKLAGHHREATLFAGSFPDLRHPLLDRIKSILLPQWEAVPTRYQPSALFPPWSSAEELTRFLEPLLARIQENPLPSEVTSQA